MTVMANEKESYPGKSKEDEGDGYELNRNETTIWKNY